MWQRLEELRAYRVQLRRALKNEAHHARYQCYQYEQYEHGGTGLGHGPTPASAPAPLHDPGLPAPAPGLAPFVAAQAAPDSPAAGVGDISGDSAQARAHARTQEHMHTYIQVCNVRGARRVLPRTPCKGFSLLRSALAQLPP